jgi:hypothetical protein
MRILITASLIFFISANTKASGIYVDTTHPVKPYKIFHKQFLEEYGKDDTSRAIINYYFKKRTNAGKDIIVMSTITAVSGSLLLVFAESNAVILPFFAEGLFAAAFWTLGITLIACLYRLFHFSRKNLLKELNDYFSGKEISFRLKKRLYKKKNWF